MSEDTHFGDKRLTSFFRGNRVDIEKENGGVFLILFLSTKGERKRERKRKKEKKIRRRKNECNGEETWVLGGIIQ